MSIIDGICIECSILLLLQNYCTALDAELVRIETQSENNFLKTEIQKLHLGKKSVQRTAFSPFYDTWQRSVGDVDNRLCP